MSKDCLSLLYREDSRSNGSQVQPELNDADAFVIQDAAFSILAGIYRYLTLELIVFVMVESRTSREEMKELTKDIYSYPGEGEEGGEGKGGGGCGLEGGGRGVLQAKVPPGELVPWPHSTATLHIFLPSLLDSLIY